MKRFTLGLLIAVMLSLQGIGVVYSAPLIVSDIQSPVVTRRVSTLTDLQNLTGSDLIQSVRLMGRTTPGDGGQGVFRWDSSDLSSEILLHTQKGIYVPPDSDVTGATGAWVRLYEGHVMIEWFGNDATAVQASINFALDKGLDVKVTTLITISSSIYIDRPVDTTSSEFTIFGEGEKAGFVIDSAMTMFSSTIASTTYAVSEHITFSNVTFKSNVSSGLAKVLDLDKFLRMKFTDCVFLSINLGNNLSGNTMQSYRLTRCNIRGFEGVFMSGVNGYDIHFTDNISEHNNLVASTFFALTGILRGSDFKGNIFENATGPFYQVGNAQGVLIAGNYFEEITEPILRLGASQQTDIQGNFFQTSNGGGYYAVDCGASFTVNSSGNYASENMYDTSSMTPGYEGVISTSDVALGEIFNGLSKNYGTFQAELTGFASPLAITVSYRKEGNTVTLSWPDANSTSVTTAMTMTGIPSSLMPTSTNKKLPALTVDQAVTTWGTAEISTTGVIDFRPTPTFGSVFTATGVKGLTNNSVTYTVYP